MADKAYKFVLTGPESTGKTTLALRLASAFSIDMVEEAARNYLAEKQDGYVPEDVRIIAQIQKEAQAKAYSLGKSIVCDTDLLTILIWQHDKFGHWDQNIYLEWKNNENSLYLLCAPDIPWVPDPLRENPDDRERLFQIHLDVLINHHKPFEIIYGSSDQRFFKAYHTLLTYFTSHPS